MKHWNLQKKNFFNGIDEKQVITETGDGGALFKKNRAQRKKLQVEWLAITLKKLIKGK